MPGKQLTITGLTTNKGKLELYNKGLLNDFCGKNPDKKIIITVKVEESGSKNAMLSYYHSKIIPEWKQHLFEKGIVKNISEVDILLRGLTPITKNKTLSELTKDELIMFLDFVKIRSLEDVSLFIEDPRCL